MFDHFSLKTIGYWTNISFLVACICSLAPEMTANEISAKAINSEKWFHQTVIPNGKSWFNGELQHYTDRISNSFTSDGTLKIKAKREPFTQNGITKDYTSARLNSKFAFTYGRVEVRAKMPKGISGTWPAIWMLSKNINERGAYFFNLGHGNKSWPDCGEIDILEYWGRIPGVAQSAVHTRSSHGNTVNLGSQSVPTISKDFHVYSLEWTPESLTFSVDEKEHYTYAPKVKNDTTWPFDTEQYLLLNFAIESVIDPSFEEDILEVDYVRIYDKIGTLTWSDEFN